MSFDSDPRRDPMLRERPVFGAKRTALQARCEVLRSTIEDLDRQAADLARQRRTASQELRAHRRRLFARVALPGRQPAPDGSIRLPPIAHDATWVTGRRLRVLCLAVLARFGPMELAELHAILHRLRFAIANRHPAKALADACGHEHDIGRIRRLRRGFYEALTTPPKRPLWQGGPRAEDLFSGFERPL